MMLKIFLIVLAILILISLAGYALHLMLKLRVQKRQEKQLIEEAQKARYLRILESIDVITKAMLSTQCNLSEGVLRLKPLLDVLGKKLSRYTAMWTLYEVVENMPILDERKNLKRNERMKLDLEREAKEAELESDIKIECYQLLQDIEEIKKAI